SRGKQRSGPAGQPQTLQCRPSEGVPANNPGHEVRADRLGERLGDVLPRFSSAWAGTPREKVCQPCAVVQLEAVRSEGRIEMLGGENRRRGWGERVAMRGEGVDHPPDILDPARNTTAGPLGGEQAEQCAGGDQLE